LTDAPYELSTGQCATLACLLEATAPKPGNVHRGADFEDMSFTDFVASAAAIAPAMELAPKRGVGRTVLDSIRATRQLVRANTNLGMVLLLAPMAAVPRTRDFSDGISEVLAGLTSDDSRDVYAAIRLAGPGGLGDAEEMDVAGDAPVSLLDAMRAAAEWDLVARQYAEDFAQVLTIVVPWIREGQAQGWSLTESIIHTHLRLISRFADSLIARKCGLDTAREVSTRAQAVLEAGMPGDANYFGAAADFDFWLRSDGNRRNPGTTADLIAAGLFIGLRDAWIKPPFD
jgi:triphosphoribosyl-dephospho-CoA synthase